MKKDKLLRSLIREILLNEDEGGGYDVESPSQQDSVPQLDNQGNPKYSSSHSHSSMSASGHAAQGGTSDWLYGNLKTVTNPAIDGVKNVGSAVAKAGAQAISIAWLLNNPWTASLFGDKWLKNYLDTTEQGSATQIGVNTLKSALMKDAKILGGFTLPQLSAAANVLGITTLFSSLPTLINKFQQYRNIYPLYNSFFDNLLKIQQQIPKVPQDVKNLFTVDKNDKAALDNYIYSEFTKALSKKKSSSPISGNIIQVENEALKIIQQENVQNANELISKLTQQYGIDSQNASRLANFIFFAAGRQQPQQQKPQKTTKQPKK